MTRSAIPIRRIGVRLAGSLGGSYTEIGVG